MNILISCFSRTGNTERLAHILAEQLQLRGHDVTLERIQPLEHPSKWHLVPPLLSTLPVLPFYLCSTRFRQWWLQRYRQPEQDIHPLNFPDVSRFDRICLGGPKWLYLSYPLATYLRQISGLPNKRVGAFATFCGPPLQAFEIEMLFVPLKRRIEERGGTVASTLAVSSQFHEFFFFHEMEYLFRALSHLVFKRPLCTFALDSDWAHQEINRFCDEICAPDFCAHNASIKEIQ